MMVLSIKTDYQNHFGITGDVDVSCVLSYSAIGSLRFATMLPNLEFDVLASRAEWLRHF